MGQGLFIIEASLSYSDTPQLVELLWRGISPSQRTLPNNTQHLQQKAIHVPGRIQTHNPSKPEAAEPRLRPRGHWGSFLLRALDTSVISFTSWLLYTRRKNPGPHWIGGWMETKISLVVLDTRDISCSCRKSNSSLRSSNSSLVTTSTELSQLQ